MNDNEKLKESIDAFNEFLNQLDGPNDVYKKIVVLTILAELLGYKLEFKNK